MVFGWFKKKAPAPEPAYLGLRDQVLSIRPAEIQLSKSAELPDVWGVLMESGYPEATVTLVALGEGTTSLYFSNGGGIIGAGEHEPVAQATAKLISRSQKYCRKNGADKCVSPASSRVRPLLPADIFGSPHCRGHRGRSRS